MPLGVSEDGEGRVAGGVYASQFLQCLAVLLQPLRGGLQAVWEGQGGEGGGRGQLGLWTKWRKDKLKVNVYYNYYATDQQTNKIAM